MSAELTDLLPEQLPAGLRFLAGGGEATRLILSRSWTDHPLGPPETWPDALKVALGLVLNSPETMLLCWGREELICFFNEAYIPLLGPRLHRAMGEPLREVWADAWDQAQPIITEAFAGRPERFVDLPWLLDTDRGPRETWWSFSYSRVLDTAGEIAGLFVFTNETTDRVLADAAVRKSDELLRLEVERQRLSLQQMPGFIAITSGPTHVYEYVNDAFVAIAGTRDFVGQPARDVFSDLEGQGLLELLDQAYASGKPFSGRALPVRLSRDGVERFVDLLTHPTSDAAGQVTGLFIGGYDVTDSIRAERRREALLRLDDNLRDEPNTAALSYIASRLLGEALGAVRVGFGVVDPDAQTITIERNWNLEGYADVAGVHRLSDYGSFVDELLQGKAVVNANVDRDPRTADKAANFHALGICAHLDVPVMEHGQTVAQMFAHSSTPRAWTDEEVELVRDFALKTRVTIERRRAEHELATSEERYREIVEGAEDFAIVTLDKAGTITGWNSGAERLIGFPASEAVGQAGAIIFTEEDRNQGVPEQELNRANSDGRAIDERWHQRRDGSRFWGSGLMMRLDRGGYLKIFRDRTAEHEAEARLRESEARFRLLTQSMAEVFYLADHDAGKVIYVSPAYERLWGRSAEELYTDITAYTRAIRFEDQAAAEAAFAQQARGEPTEVEYRITSDDGHVRWILDRSYPAPSDGRRLAAGVAEDITARREAEERLRELNETLEARVAERTAELEAAHEQLRQSQKLESMGQLTGGVAHDFNNLLTPIVGALDMLQRRGVGGEREARLISGAAQSAERAKTLVQRLLAFARRQPLQPVAVDVAALVRNMADLIASTSGPQIRVSVEIGDDLPPAKGDPNQLEMALLNLAVNARDAMPDGGTLRVSATEERVQAGVATLAPGAYVRLSVADDGTGMDEETLARAVEPFFSTKGVGKGTGLGLSMVHGLASQLGGALTIDSKPGLGTNVSLWLPRSGEVPEQATSGATVEPCDGRGTALLVDDEEAVRVSTADMLGDLGYDVIEAASAEEALAVVRNGTHLDVVLTDHLMPGMTGSDLVRVVRSLRPGVPVLVISGYAESEGIQPDLPRLTKPFRRDELAAAIAGLGSGDAFG